MGSSKTMFEKLEPKCFPASNQYNLALEEYLNVVVDRADNIRNLDFLFLKCVWQANKLFQKCNNNGVPLQLFYAPTPAHETLAVGLQFIKIPLQLVW